MRTLKKGFTLIELIVVIAILAILAAVAIPSYNGLKEESERQVCDTNIDTLLRCYLARRAMDKAETPQASWDKVMEENSTIECPDDDGDYTVSFSGNTMKITCSKHGTKTLTGTDVSKTLTDTIKGLVESGKISSTANIDSTSTNGQRTAAINEALKAAGISTQGTTWTVGNIGGKYYVSWAETAIPEGAKAGDTVLAIRYNESLGTYTVGDVKLEWRPEGGNLGLQTNGIKEYTGVTQNAATKSSFEEAYKIYQAALAERAGRERS